MGLVMSPGSALEYIGEGFNGYTINTRGAGLIQVTGSSQMLLCDYLKENETNPEKRANLEKLYDGYDLIDGAWENYQKEDGIGLIILIE